MNSSRDRILARVREGLGREVPYTAHEVEQARTAELDGAPAPRPLWTGAVLDRFLERYTAAAGTCSRVGSPAGAVEAIVAYLRERKLALSVRLAPHPVLRALPWPEGFDHPEDGNIAEARVGVSVAEAALAETGTLVLCSGPESPTTLNFLPEYHVVVLRSHDVVGYMEDAWHRLRQRPEFPPRTVNFITGPSRTADVEQTIQLGAHGPRSLHVILLDEVDPAGTGQPVSK